MLADHIHLQLPDWLNQKLAESKQPMPEQEERMRFVIELAHLNIEHQTGGPFGAAIFDMDTHQLIGAGVNLVVDSHCSMAHAEMAAIATAQQNLQNFDLGAPGMPRCELITSTEPCAMCFGALPWSGIRHLVCGARDADARAIGFDEGPKLPDWITALNERGISVVTDVCREEAAAVLQRYQALNGEIYNGRGAS